VTRAGDDAERSDEEERRHDSAGDDAAPDDDAARESGVRRSWAIGSDAAERRMIPADDDGGRSDLRPGDKSTPDPWKSFRGVMAGTLILEAIVVLLALPVVSTVGGGLTSAALGYLIGLAGLLVLLVGLQGRSWAIWVNLAVQLIPIVGFVVYPGVGFIGVLFAAVWALIAYFRAEVIRRERRGLLPGQQRSPD
jgi:hypothetical protein